jgi:hypothetical protein
MKINYTKQMKEAPLGEVFHTIDWKYNKGMRQSEWQHYRIVKVVQGEEEYYTIQETSLHSVIYFIPRWLGGKGWFNHYSEMEWGEWDGDIKVFATYQEAKDTVQSAIDWVDAMYRELDKKTLPKVSTVISWHPDEEEML